MLIEEGRDEAPVLAISIYIVSMFISVYIPAPSYKLELSFLDDAFLQRASINCEMYNVLVVPGCKWPGSNGKCVGSWYQVGDGPALMGSVLLPGCRWPGSNGKCVGSWRQVGDGPALMGSVLAVGTRL